MYRIFPTALLPGLYLAICVDSAAGQTPTGPPGSSADSVRITASARRDQADFERIRRAALPETRGGGSGRRCDERIGRFCLTHDDGWDSWIAPPEPDRVTGERAALLQSLADAARQLPGDAWIAGQQVRYLIEARRHQEAVEAVARCRSEAAWCAALSGYTYHHAGHAEQADSAFSAALVGMPDDQRERWTDLSLVLDADGRRAYKELAPAARADFEWRFWRFADPLLTQTGNELRSEHLARHVMDRLQAGAESVEGSSWTTDRREVLIRYGWPVGWERIESPLVAAGPPELISHLADSPFRLLPPSSAVSLALPPAGPWDVEESRPRAEYEIPLGDSTARWLYPLDHQLAFFRRGDDILAVGAYALPGDSISAGPRIEARLALIPLQDPGLTTHQSGNSNGGLTGAVTSMAPNGPLLVSLEVVVAEDGRIGRARSVVYPAAAGLPSLSDLLLIGAGAGPADSIGPVLPHALGSNRVRPDDEIGIYWEAYGLSVGDGSTASMSLRVFRERTGWLRRLGERAGLLRQESPISLRWEEPLAPGAMTSRSVVLRIPRVPPGEYTIELSAESAGRLHTTRRVIDVVR